MSCCKPCDPCCQPCGPCPLASSCNECCVRQCQSSHVVIEPPAVLVTLPGPILSSFPQNTAVGSSTSAAVGNILSCGGVPISSGGFDLSCITNCYGTAHSTASAPGEPHEWQEEAAPVQTPRELASLRQPLKLLYRFLPLTCPKALSPDQDQMLSSWRLLPKDVASRFSRDGICCHHSSW
ncbi:hypothetical protein DV515_00018455 [Chloebia gouldiae]|uniref:Keratin n=1 Tax=Chloebia gouldiae TaxID=44316 RepID=A0A3L8Q7H2_CHLGU|nr:hypothetical protein DV515_00018455 [Chloebia gouldiae]